MSEYIISKEQLQKLLDLIDPDPLHVTKVRIGADIVRCRDCEFSSDDGLTVLWCAENCREVRRDGFCAWAERKEASDDR